MDKSLNKIDSLLLNLDGGLGNQIFQYLAAKHILNSTESVNLYYYHVSEINPLINNLISDSNFIYFSKTNSTKNFSFTKKIINKISNSYKELDIWLQFRSLHFLSNNFYFREQKKFIKKEFSLENRIKSLDRMLKKSKNSIKLDIYGFWQDPTPYESNLLSISTNFQEKLLKNTEKIKFKPGSYISVHHRRGDYLNNLNNAKEYASNHSFLSFLTSSLNILPSEYDDYPIVIVSDDISWFNKINLSRLSLIKREFLFSSGDPIDDWLILNNSKISIISNSTFSYTAALLNTSNFNSKLRSIMPFWYNCYQTTLSKGWHKPNGFIAI